MNEKIFQFVDAEIASTTDHDRIKKLRAIKGYLQAAQELRRSFDSRSYNGEYHCSDRRAERFDIDCDRVAF